TLHEIVESRHICSQNLLPGRELLVQLTTQYFEDLMLLLRGRTVTGLHTCAEAIELLVEHVREGQVSLRTFHVYLDELLFDRSHPLVESRGVFQQRLHFPVTFETLPQGFELASQGADLVYGAMQIGIGIAHLHGQVELLLQVGGLYPFDSGIQRYLERLRLALIPHAELHRVMAR